MKRRMKMLAFLLTAALLLVTACADGSGGNASNANDGGSGGSGEKVNHAGEDTNTETPGNAIPEEHVELTYYYWGWKTEGEKDVKLVEEEINKYIGPKINASIRLKFQGFSEYGPKINTMLASGEKFDIFWGGFLFGYYDNVAKGAFLELNDLLDEYGEETKQALPDWAWKAATYSDGKIYGVPALQTSYNNTGLNFQKRFVEKYNIDVNTVRTLDDLEPYLAKYVEDNPLPGVKPMRAFGWGDIANTWLGLEKIGDKDYIGIRTGDDGLKVINPIDTPEVLDLFKRMEAWNAKGYLANKKPDEDKAKLEGYPFSVGAVIKPGGEAEAAQHNGGEKRQPIVLQHDTKAYLPAAFPMQTFNAISRTSANPERAMMFLNMMNSDKTLFNLLAHGIEGKHYTKVDANTYKKIPDSGYDPGADWEFGNSFLSYVLEGQPADVFEQAAAINNNAEKSKLLGFSFNPEPVQSEIANLDAIGSEYMDSFHKGLLDVDKKYPEYLAKLEKAGLKKVHEEAQRQLDEWKAKQ